MSIVSSGPLSTFGFGCGLLVRLDFAHDVPKVLDVHLQGHSLGEVLSGDAGSRNVLHSRGNLDRVIPRDGTRGSELHIVNAWLDLLGGECARGIRFTPEGDFAAG